MDEREWLATDEFDEIHQAFDRARQFKRQVANMAKMIDWPSEEKYMERASGKVICELCGLEYYNHPEKNGLFLSCNGRLLKL